MSTTTKLTTNNQRYATSEQVMQTLQDAQRNYYFFFGNHDPAISTPPMANAAEYTTSVLTYDSMVAGKKIMPSDVVSGIRNIPYISNTVYGMYDDTDPFLIDRDFFVIAD